jgi:hypothetical protein
MKAVILGIALFAVLTGNAFAATGSAYVLRQDDHLCLRTDHIQHKTVVDTRTITFTMDDGTTWKNTLQKDCASLNTRDGFRWTTRDNHACGDQQPIVVGATHQTCYLGDFTQVPPAR